jgi:predicted nuclease with TOPRIM domain
MVHKRKDELTVEELRGYIKQAQDTLTNLKSNIARLEDEYGDWEDRLWAIENGIQHMEQEKGITREEIYQKPDVDLPFEN